MKNFFKPLIILSITAFAMYGCSDSGNVSTAPQDIPTESVSESTVENSEPVSQPAYELAVIEPADGTYIYDNAKVLSAEDFSECNNYAEWLSENLMLNVAVVTTNDLQTLSPEMYAEKCYNDIFKGTGCGIIVLINNDTNKDFIYKHGTPLLYISEKAEKEIFFSATKHIVSNAFGTAVKELLSLAELCPHYVFDSGNAFIQSQADELESVLKANESVNACITAVTNSSEKPNSELSAELYKRHYPENKGSMLFINTHSGESVVITDGKPVKADDVQLKKINELTALKDYYGAAEQYFAMLGISPQNATEITNNLNS